MASDWPCGAMEVVLNYCGTWTNTCLGSQAKLGEMEKGKNLEWPGEAGKHKKTERSIMQLAVVT